MWTREGYRWAPRSWQPSAAQRRVLDQIERGATNPAIAEQLGISRETVKTHIGQLLAATQCGSREELAHWWSARKQSRSGFLPLVTLARFVAAAVVALAVAATTALSTSVLVFRIHGRGAPPPIASVSPGPAATDTAITPPCSRGPTLGIVEGEPYLGCLVVEPGIGFAFARYPGAGDPSRRAEFRARALAALQAPGPYVSTPPLWPQTQTIPWPTSASGRPAPPFQGRVVIEFWETTTRLAVGANGQPAATLVDSTRTLLGAFALTTATPPAGP